jgi:hypothetical protein
VAIRRLIDFAATCVFTKQSLEPILCGLLQFKCAWHSPLMKAPLLPKLRGHFAEFLLHDSLEHLRLLASPTCVGLRYGRKRHSHTRLFSAASFENPWFGPKASTSASGLTFNPADLPTGPGYAVTSGLPAPDGSVASASPLMVRRTFSGTGIFTRFPSPTPLGLGLGAG